MDEDIQASKVRVVASQERQAKQEIEIARLQAENGRLDEEYKARCAGCPPIRTASSPEEATGAA